MSKLGNNFLNYSTNREITLLKFDQHTFLPMRLILKLSQNQSFVPYNYQRSLVGAFHKWLGSNEIHDEVSLYSLSWLQGGQKTKGGLEFSNGAEWQISIYSSQLLKPLIKGIQNNPEVCFGMAVKEVTICEPPVFSSKQKFYLNSPIFIKRKKDDRIQFYFHYDIESDALMTATLQTKLKKAGIPFENVKVMFDRSYHSPKTKIIKFNGIDCRASICPIYIEGTQEQIAFAWKVGIGNSTGIGFGALK